MKKILKKLQLIFLSCVFLLIASNTYAYKDKLEPWEVTEAKRDGAYTNIRANKEYSINGKEYIKNSTAKVTASIPFIKKLIKTTGAVVAVDLAIEALIGGVDYVMNNAAEVVEYDAESDEYVYSSFECKKLRLDEFLACIETNSPYASNTNFELDKCYFTDGLKYGCYGTRIATGTYGRIGGTTAQRELLGASTKRTLSYDQLAKELVNRANAQDADAIDYVGQATDDMLTNDANARNDLKRQLEANGQTATEQDVKPKEDENGQPNANENGFELPAFCSWAPIVCEAANAVISLPETLKTWWETATSAITDTWNLIKDKAKEVWDWVKDEENLPERDESEIILEDLPFEQQVVNVNFGSSCPAPTSLNVSFAGKSHQITIMNYEYICEWAWLVHLSVVALASISAVFIVAGRSS